MRLHRLTDLLSARHYVPIAAALLFVALGDAVSGPYNALFLADRAHLGPLALGSLLTARAVCAIAIGFAFGRWFDRTPSVAPLFLALGGAIVGNVMLAFTTNYLALLAIVCLPLATAAAGFPQLFALAKGHLDEGGDSMTAERGVALLRALWSVAWAVGPAIGAMVIEPYDFRGVFLGTALSGAIGIAIILGSRVRAPQHAVSVAKPVSRIEAVRAAGFAALALTMFATAMFMGSVALSISVTHDMGGEKQDVGHAFSLCAFLEVLVMSVFVIRPVNSSSRAWMSAGFAAFILYFAVIALVPTVTVVLAAQAIRAVAIGIVGCLGIGYAQSVVKGVGAAAALFANAFNAGFLLSGLGTGALASAFGYQSLFSACAVLSGLGLLALLLQPRSASPQPRHGI